MGLFDPETGIGVNYSGYGLEFSMGFSAKIRFRGFLSQKCVGWAVTYPRISGNIVFKWPMHGEMLLLVILKRLGRSNHKGV